MSAPSIPCRCRAEEGRRIAGLAHDLNNLFTVINGYSDLLLMQLAPNDPARPLLEQIRQAGGRAVNLTEQLTAPAPRA